MSPEEKVKPIYQQLMGILSQTPSFENTYTALTDPEIWEHYNKVVDNLNATTKKDYNDFKVEPKWEHWEQGESTQHVNGTLFRQKLNGLINHIHAEYFPREKTPFGGEPQNVFEQNQVVSQSTDVQVIMMAVLEVQEKLIKNEDKYPVDSPENKFIKVLKESLKNVKSHIELVNLILQTAIATGLTLDKLKTIFA